MWMVTYPDINPEFFDTEKEAQDAFDTLVEELNEEASSDNWCEDAESAALTVSCD